MGVCAHRVYMYVCVFIGVYAWIKFMRVCIGVSACSEFICMCVWCCRCICMDRVYMYKQCWE